MYCTVASDVSNYLSPLRNPLHVVHSVALLVLAAIAASHRPHKNGHDLFLSSRVASVSTSGKYFNGYIGPHLTRFESTSKETLGDGCVVDSGVDDDREPGPLNHDGTGSEAAWFTFAGYPNQGVPICARSPLKES